MCRKIAFFACVVVISLSFSVWSAVEKEKPDFTFIQVADPQMTFCESSIANWQQAVNKVNILEPAFLIITGDLLNTPGDQEQANSYLSVVSGLKPNIPLYNVAGNHDLHDAPSPTSYAWYQRHFGNPWYSFTYRNNLFIVLESNILKDSSNYPGKDTEQMNWLTTTLANASGYNNIMVFMHHPLCLNSINESDTYSNMPTVRRMQLLNIFHQYNVRAVFAGHYHQNAYVRDGELEIITTSSCTCPLAEDPPGLRIVKVYPNHIEHSYHTLDSIKALTGNLMTGIMDTMPPINAYKKVYIVPYTHLDLQWNWTLQTTINEYLPNTLRQNFSLFEKYPGYRFSFEGAYRYMLIKRYYPSDYRKLKKYIADGKWNVAGSMVEAPDVNIPSPEALIRQILYGNKFFQEEFGKTSVDLLLPDCFGFSYTLPTIAVHCGLKGFSTQKFDRWGGFRPTPFSIGQWEGVDGSRITAALKPGDYLSTWEIREQDLNELGKSTGVYVSYDYFGQGDIGGAPNESQVASLMKRILENNTAPIEVLCASSDQIFRDLTIEQVAKLPVYKGELLATLHGTGCYTAHADMKALNRANELMANSAERASVIAELFGGTVYPRDELKQNWLRFLCHAFHDDLTGTSIQDAYDKFSLPDERAALLLFTQIRDNANIAVASKLDTSVDNPDTTVPVVVYNPVAIARHDIAEVTVQLPGSTPRAVRIYDKNSIEVPSQIKEISGKNIRILFMADVPAVGYSVYQIKKTAIPCSISTGLQVSPVRSKTPEATTEPSVRTSNGMSSNKLENRRYRVTIDDSGDISSIFDKVAQKELLSGPSRFEIRNNRSANWPAWEVLYEDVRTSPRSYVDESVRKTIVDNGPAQVTVRVTRSKENSNYTHYYSLTADTEGSLKVENIVDWKENNPNGSLLKVSFPLTTSNPNTTYDLGLGTIERGVNYPNLYEVPGHQWADITSPDKSYGVAILNNCKYGWDKPADNKIQLTLIHTPNGKKWNYTGDRYVHNFTYAVYGHPGDWADGGVVSAGECLNQPYVTFQTTAHKGVLGKSFSFVTPDPLQVAIMAVKKAESGNEYIIRVREITGKNWQNVSLAFNAEVVTAREVNGMEEQKGGVNYTNNAISFPIGLYQPKTFAVQLKNPFGASVKREERHEILAAAPILSCSGRPA